MLKNLSVSDPNRSNRKKIITWAKAGQRISNRIWNAPKKERPAMFRALCIGMEIKSSYWSLKVTGSVYVTFTGWPLLRPGIQRGIAWITRRASRSSAG